MFRKRPKWGGGLWQQADLLTPMTIRVAATLRIVDHLKHGFTSIQELAEVTATDTGALRRLMKHLTSIGLLEEYEDDHFQATPTGKHLEADHPDGVREWLDIEGGVGRADLSFIHLLHSIRTGNPSFPEFFGVPYWDDVTSDPNRSRSFDELMSRRMKSSSEAIIEAYDWSALSTAIDVGGGEGTLMLSLLSRFPSLRGAVLELPGSATRAAENARIANLSARFEAISGNFFDKVPAPFDAYILSSVVHDWDDRHAVHILQNCARSAPATSRVLIIEAVADTSSAIAKTSESDLRMLAYSGGRERSIDDFALLAKFSGLEVKSVHNAGRRVIIECVIFQDNQEASGGGTE